MLLSKFISYYLGHHSNDLVPLPAATTPDDDAV